MFNDFHLGDAIDFELDFDLGDFELVKDGEKEAAPRTRILKPRIDVRSVSQRVCYKNAQKMAAQIDLSPGARTFAWVSGDFIFGDLLEALVVKKRIDPRRIYICSLGMSQDNIDSLKNILCATRVEKLTVLLSGYFYSHERDRLIPYLYEQLDVGDVTQVAFANYHCKIIAVETWHGHYFTIHGSANMRSSNSIEQIVVEEGEELYRFNADIMEQQARLYGTIDHSVPSGYYIRRNAAWQAAAENGKEPTN